MPLKPEAFAITREAGTLRLEAGTASRRPMSPSSAPSWHPAWTRPAKLAVTGVGETSTAARELAKRADRLQSAVSKFTF